MHIRLALVAWNPRGMLRMQHIVILVIVFTPVMCYGSQPPKVCNAQGTFKYADTLLKQKNYEQAKVALDRLHNCQGLSVIDTFNLAWLYGRAHDFKTALQVFQSISPNVPDPLTHAYAVALTQFELGDFNGTVHTLTTLQSQGKFDTKCRNLLGVAYSKLGLYQQAYPLFTKELQDNPHDLFAYLNLVTLFADTGNFTKADDIANQAVQVFPDNSEIFVVRGSIHTLLGKLNEAHSDFATAAKLAPTQADPRFFLALSDYKQGNFVHAENELQLAIASGIVDADLHYLLAECIRRIDPANSKEALRELDRAIAIDGRSVSSRSLRGKLLLEQGHPKRAVTDLKVALQIDPGSRSAIYNLARAYSALGETEEAKTMYKQLSTHAGNEANSTTAVNADSLNELSEQRLKQTLAGSRSQ